MIYYKKRCNITKIKIRRIVMSNGTIFIVEDNEMLKSTLVDSLKMFFKNTINTYSSAEELSEIIKNLKTQEKKFFIIDILLPGKNGIALSQEILSIVKNAHIITMTGDMQKDYQIIARNAGAIKHFLKPFKIYELQETIEKLL